MPEIFADPPSLSFASREAARGLRGRTGAARRAASPDDLHSGLALQRKPVPQRTSRPVDSL